MALTVAAVLGDGDEGRGCAGLERRLARSGTAAAALGAAAGAAHRLLDEQVATAVQTLLQADVGDLLLEGWRSMRELVAAAGRTREAPGRPEDVLLAEHVVTYSRQPVVEVRVDWRPVATLEFDLALSLTLRGVVAVVDGGRLVALRCGDLDAEAVLSLRGLELTRGAVEVVAGAVLSLGSGVPLVAAPAPVVPGQREAPRWEEAATAPPNLWERPG